MQNKSIDDLAKVYAVKDLPREHLQWIYDRCEYKEFEDGVIPFKTGEPIEVLWFIAEGRFDFYLDVNGQLVYYYNFQNDPVTGGVGGLLPYSRMKVSPGNAYAVGIARTYSIHKKYFPELEQMNPEFIQKLIGYMTERARSFATTQMQHEKVSALGRLAAGIAHEMNNPASAINRIADELARRLNDNYSLTAKLLDYRISSAHIQSISNMVEKKGLEALKKLSMMQRMQKEDEMNDWFERNDLGGNNIPPETFTEAGITGEDLEGIRGGIGKEEFIHVLQWVENLLTSKRIIKDLGESSARISTLVGAIKSHVHMDQTNDLQPTDIHRDIENTLTLMGYKLREKNITVKKIFSEELPDIPVYVGEMNQVWTNIIDNAIYAMPKNGELTIETSFDPKNVYVKITDNGKGIPKEILSKIFDPFFTTKKVGEGTGIGLDLVNRIIKHHGGEIKVHSEPGKTEFAICIPIQETKDKPEQRARPEIGDKKS